MATNEAAITRPSEAFSEIDFGDERLTKRLDLLGN